MNKIIHLNKTNFFASLNRIKHFSDVKHILKNFNPCIISDGLTDNIIRTDEKDKYTRHQIFKNDRLDCYLLFWQPKAVSKIHDHPDNGCYLKVLDGYLIETRYTFRNKNLKKINNNILIKNSVSYIDDTKGIHSIYNPTNMIVPSLHVYSPPNYIANIY